MSRGYSQETKLQAVRLCLEGGKVKEVVDELGVSESSIRRWLKDPTLARGPVPTSGGMVPRPISQSARELLEGSISPNTRRAYLSALGAFDDWLDTRFSSEAALRDATVAEYLTKLHEAGKSPATCAQVVAAIKFRAKLHGAPSPIGPMSDRILAGIRRKGHDRGRGQVTGVSLKQAEHVADLAARGNDLSGLRDSAIIAVMSDGLLRVSEAAALEVRDLFWERDGSGRLLIRSSKTDQTGTGAVQFLGPPTVERIRAWLRKAGIRKGPLFRRLYPGRTEKVGQAGLSTVSIRDIIQYRCAEAGIRGYISGHSLRVGAAQSLAAAGASLVELQTEGRWTSPTMPGHYARNQLAARGPVARYRHQHRP